MIPLDLRPLGIGEIFDRAVTLFVRHFAVLVLILAVVSIPVAIVAYAVDPTPPDAAGLAATFQRMVRFPAASVQEQRAVIREFFGLSSTGPLDFEVALVSEILGLVATTACAIAVAQVSAGERPSVRAVYRAALRRFPAQLGASVVFAGLAFVAIAALFIVVIFLSLPFVAIDAIWPGAATVMIGPGSLVVALVFLLGVSLLNLVMQMTIVSIALEKAQSMRGIASGLRRTLSRPMLRRSTLVATIDLGVSWIGSLMLLGIAGGLSSVTHVAALSAIIAAIGDTALAALSTTFVVMYAFDVRVRREGYDLAIAAQAASL